MSILVSVGFAMLALGGVLLWFGHTEFAGISIACGSAALLIGQLFG